MKTSQIKLYGDIISVDHAQSDETHRRTVRRKHGFGMVFNIIAGEAYS